MDGFSGVRDPQQAWEERWAYIKPWLDKYRSGELTEIPAEIREGMIKGIGGEWASAYTDIHSAIEAWIYFQQEEREKELGRPETMFEFFSRINLRTT